MSKLTLSDYEDAMYSQSACNLSAIAHSLTDVLGRIRQEVHGTDAVNKHPIVRLYVEQMAHLSGAGVGDLASYHLAYAHVNQRIDELKREAEERERAELDTIAKLRAKQRQLAAISR